MECALSITFLDTLYADDYIIIMESVIWTLQGQILSSLRYLCPTHTIGGGSSPYNFSTTSRTSLQHGQQLYSTEKEIVKRFIWTAMKLTVGGNYM